LLVLKDLIKLIVFNFMSIIAGLICILF
jgi:hypothetical protein